MLRLRKSQTFERLQISYLAFAKPFRTSLYHHARKAEKLITLIATPAYDPTIKVNIILIISCVMDV